MRNINVKTVLDVRMATKNILVSASQASKVLTFFNLKNVSFYHLFLEKFLNLWFLV